MSGDEQPHLGKWHSRRTLQTILRKVQQELHDDRRQFGDHVRARRQGSPLSRLHPGDQWIPAHLPDQSQSCETGWFGSRARAGTGQVRWVSSPVLCGCVCKRNGVSLTAKTQRYASTF